MRAAVYTRLSQDRERVSATDAGTSSATGLDTQRRECERRVATGGWAYDPAEDLFVETASAFAEKRRPTYDALWTALRTGKYTHVVVYSVDRFSRRWREWGRLLDELDELKVSLIIVSPSLDTSDPMSKTALSLLAAMAQQESQTTGARVQRARTSMLDPLAGYPGRHPGGNLPYGWETAPHPTRGGRTLVHRPEEVTKLREAVQAVLEGASVNSIAHQWNAEGVPTKKGSGKWYPNRLMDLLRSPLLLGEWPEGPDRQPVLHPETREPFQFFPAIVSHAEYEQLQAKLAKRTYVRTAVQAPLLSGLLYCGLCGARMSGKASTKQQAASYQCQARRKSGASVCTGVTIRSGMLDAAARAWVLALVSDETLTSLFNPTRTEESTEYDKISHAVAGLLRRRERIITGWENGDYDLDPNGERSYRAKLAKLDTELAKLNAAQAAHEPTVEEQLRGAVGASDLGTALRAIRDGWDALELHQKRSVVAAVLSRVEVGPSQHGRGMKGIPRAKRWWHQANRVKVTLTGASVPVNGRTLDTFLVNSATPFDGNQLRSAHLTLGDVAKWLYRREAALEL